MLFSMCSYFVLIKLFWRVCIKLLSGVAEKQVINQWLSIYPLHTKMKVSPKVDSIEHYTTKASCSWPPLEMRAIPE